MSETVTQTEQQEQPQSPFVSGEIETVPVEIHGKEYKLNCRPKSRTMRNEAIEEAAIAYQAKYGEGKKGLIPTVFERSYALKRIKSWDLGMPVERGWDLLDDEAGDAISEAIGIKSILEGIGGKKNREVEDAKN